MNDSELEKWAAKREKSRLERIEKARKEFEKDKQELLENSDNKMTIILKARRIAEAYLSGCYMVDPDVVEPDIEQAIFWYEKLANVANSDWTVTLADLYWDEGSKDPVNFEKAFYWYNNRLEESESIEAMFGLGRCYHYGKGVSEDNEKAIYWLEKAVEKASEKVRKKASEMPSQFKSLHEDEDDYSEIQRMLAFAYMRDNQFDKAESCVKSLENIDEAADILAVMYLKSGSSKKEQAVFWLEKAAQVMNDDSLTNLLQEMHSNINPAAMLEIYKHNAEVGGADGVAMLGSYYFHLNPPDYKAAYECFNQLTAQENVNAMFYLGWMYEKGLGVSQNLAQAVSYYRKALKLDGGHLSANYLAGSALEDEGELEQALGFYKYGLINRPWRVELTPKEMDEKEKFNGQQAEDVHLKITAEYLVGIREKKNVSEDNRKDMKKEIGLATTVPLMGITGHIVSKIIRKFF